MENSTKVLSITDRTCKNCIFRDVNSCLAYTIEATIIIDGKPTIRGGNIMIKEDWSCNKFEHINQ